nr:MAG: p29 [Citrus leprosis virus C2]
MSNIVSFSLSNPSPALIAEIMDAISRHGLNVPAGLAQAPVQRQRQVRQPQIPPHQPRQAPRQRVNPPARAAPQQAQNRPAVPPQIGLPIRRVVVAGGSVGSVEHQEYYRSLPGYSKTYGCTKYNPNTPYTIVGFKLSEPSEELAVVDAKDLKASFKRRLKSLGFPSCGTDSIIVAHEYPDHYIAVIFPGAPYQLPVECPKDKVASPEDAKKVALAGCIRDINSVTDIRGILPVSYLELERLGMPPPLVLLPDDDDDQQVDEQEE